ncbi:MAG: glycosyltransferase [Thiobacillus sp.]|nr:glycosyltransferase [Thiobacillus sp.]
MTSDTLTSSKGSVGNAQLLRLLLDNYQHVPVIEHPHSVPDGVKISICVPTYQHIKTIEKCLESLLDQDVDFSYEILLGEDGSTDGTRELCLEYAKKHPEKIRFFLHSRENNIRINGQPTGRFNFLYLLGKTNGEYIAICEGDDWWTDKNKLRLQVQSMARFPQCNVSCHPAYAESSYYGRYGGIIGYHGDAQKVIPASETILPGGGFCPTLSIMFRRNIVNSLPEWLIRAPVMDFYLLVLASNAGGCLYIPRTIGVYGSCDASESWTNRLLSNPKFAVDFEMSFLEYLDRLADEVDAPNRMAVECLRKERSGALLFARHLPREFRVSLYEDMKSTLGLKFRLAWYLSVFGRHPGFVLQIYWYLRPLLGNKTQ